MSEQGSIPVERIHQAIAHLDLEIGGIQEKMADLENHRAVLLQKRAVWLEVAGLAGAASSNGHAAGPRKRRATRPKQASSGDASQAIIDLVSKHPGITTAGVVDRLEHKIQTNSTKSPRRVLSNAIFDLVRRGRLGKHEQNGQLFIRMDHPSHATSTVPERRSETSVSQFELIGKALTARSNEWMRTTELAKIVGIPQKQIRSMVYRKGQIVFEAETRDGNVAFIRLTQKGMHRLDTLEDERRST